MKLAGWGRYPWHDVALIEPQEPSAVRRLLQGSSDIALIGRGAGRSYGDSALADTVISTRYFDHFSEFDGTTGILTCAAGVSLADVLLFSVPRGWFLPVVPGTKFATVGGAIASDVHGKNHHLDGCFSEFVEELCLMVASGEVVTCSRHTHSDLFHATCGGQGLTGIILSARLRLRAVTGAYINETTYVARDLDEVFDLFESTYSSTYSVAWIDSVRGGKELGRCIHFTGEHANIADRRDPSPRKLVVPPAPAFCINRMTLAMMNDLYFRLKSRQAGTRTIHYDGYFFPLDALHQWNRVYGRRGFLQYQFVLPLAAAKQGIADILRRLQAAGKASFPTVLKRFGSANANLLSFPTEGYTLALDFKFQDDLLPLLTSLDSLVLDHGGRLYLTKDARMSEQTFKRCYPRWEEFLAIKQRLDPTNRFASRQSLRLGLKY